MTVKDIIIKVNKMIACKEPEIYSWEYSNNVTPALLSDYNVTLSYIKQISKEHLIHLTAGMDEVVEYFNKEELADLIIKKYTLLVGNDGNEIDLDTIKNLKNFLH